MSDEIKLAQRIVERSREITAEVVAGIKDPEHVICGRCVQIGEVAHSLGQLRAAAELMPDSGVGPMVTLAEQRLREVVSGKSESGPVQ